MLKPSTNHVYISRNVKWLYNEDVPKLEKLEHFCMSWMTRIPGEAKEEEEIVFQPEDADDDGGHLFDMHPEEPMSSPSKKITMSREL